MNLPLLILRKDLRRFWPLAVLAAAFIVLGSLATLWGINLNVGNAEFDNAFQAFGTWVVVFILVVAVVQEDLTVGDKAFWRTRPITPLGLLAGKLLFFVLVLAVPAVFANLRLATALDTPWSVGLGIAVETTGFMLLAVLAAGLLAAMTSTLLQAGVAALGCVGVAVLVPLIADALFPGMHLDMPWTPNVQFPGSRIMMACLYAMAALVGLLVHQFLTRRTLRTAGLLAVTMPIVLLAAGQWSIDLIKPATLVFPDKPLAPTEGFTLAIELPAELDRTFWEWDYDTSREQRRRAVTVHAESRGAPAGRVFSVGSITARVRLSDGTEKVFSSVNPGRWNIGLRAAAIGRSLGLGSAPSEDRQRNIHLLTLSERELAVLGGQRGRLTATFAIGEEIYREVLRLPARAGAKLSRDGQLWRIDRRTKLEDSGVALEFSHFRATSMIAPFGDARPGLGVFPSYEVSYFLHNGKRGEYAIGIMRAGDDSEGIVISERVTLQFSEISSRAMAGAAKIDDAWLADAEFVVMRPETIGKTEKVVVLEDFEFPRPVGQ